MSVYTPDDVLPTPQRRIRHIASIQIRNLTPFPARDALAQTLTQPGLKPSSLLQQPADDIDLTITARRRRRVSANSLSTLLNLEVLQDEGIITTPGTRKQQKTIPKGSIHTPKKAVAGPPASTIRPKARHSPNPPSSAFTDNNDLSSCDSWNGAVTGGQYISHSQRNLEKIVSSRLVECFVTLTLLSSPSSAIHLTPPLNSSPQPPSATTISSPRKAKDVSVKRAISASVVNHRRGSSSSSTSTFSAASLSQSKPRQSLTPSSHNPPAKVRTSGPSSVSSPKASNFPSPPPTPPSRSPSRNSHILSSPLTRPATMSSNATEHGQTERILPPTPFYISPLHLPSTSPRFSNLDPEREFAPWVDLSCSHFKVTIWGGDFKLTDNIHGREKDIKGKGRESPNVARDGSTVKNDSFWKILEEWVVDLDDMEPLSPDVAAHNLPSNTLLLTVTSGETFRITPVSSTPSHAPLPPEPEYNSDGEVNASRRLRWNRETDNRRRELEALDKSRRETRMKQSASWQDLVKIVNLQACIVDTEESLKEIVRNCDLQVKGDGYLASLREVSERDESLRYLRTELEQVLQDAARVKDTVEERRNALNLRRETLAAACDLQEGDLLDHTAQALEVDSVRQRHATLVTCLSPLRTTFIQTVSSIFPIDPLSAPDLLFTILGVPLPVPISASDPGPPLSLSSLPEVTEDNTATALGYVAQVVQLVAAYLGKGLVYPVTCCGSRSVIKDPISAMMGPRMFPLYSKGVETYRFEYGVFLLNKDIEMLMMDRNLRAMDMRHTLPNLMNLLLTLTTGESAKQTTIASPIPVITSSGLPSPTSTIPPPTLDASQSQPQYELLHNGAEIVHPRKSTPLLSPLAAILRARYPSSAGRPSVKVVDEMPEPLVDHDGRPVANPEQRTGDSNDIPDPDVEFKSTVGSSHSQSSLIHSDSLEKLRCNNSGTSPPPLLNAV